MKFIEKNGFGMIIDAFAIVTEFIGKTKERNEMPNQKTENPSEDGRC